MLTDEAAEKAQHFLLENAKKAGDLRGERIYCEEMRKSLKAILMNDAPEGPVGMKEAYAYSHPRYQEHLTKLKEAVGLDEENRARREAALMRIEVWRSQSANVRGKL